MINEIGKKCLLKFFASIKGFEKVMIQSKVFHFAKEPGVSKVNSKNAEELLASPMKSKVLRSSFKLMVVIGLRQGAPLLECQTFKTQPQADS